jgi:hypothetical protein
LKPVEGDELNDDLRAMNIPIWHESDPILNKANEMKCTLWRIKL